MNECRKKKSSNGRGGTNGREKRRPHKPENSFARRCTTYAKASMARDLLNRQSQSAYRRRGARECGCLPQNRERLPRAHAGRPGATTGKAKDRAGRGGRRSGAPGQSCAPSSAKAIPPPPTRVSPARRTWPLGKEAGGRAISRHCGRCTQKVQQPCGVQPVRRPELARDIAGAREFGALCLMSAVWPGVTEKTPGKYRPGNDGANSRCRHMPSKEEICCDGRWLFSWLP